MKKINLCDRASISLDASEQEPLIDELMSLVDFGQTINEPCVEIGASRCLWTILRNAEGVSDKWLR